MYEFKKDSAAEELNIDEYVRQAKNGDAEAFSAIVSLYEKRVYNMALKMSGNIYDAEDIAQEVFLKIYLSLNKFNEQSAFLTWVFRIAHNTCLDYLRKHRIKTLSLNNEPDFNAGRPLIDPSSGPEQAYEEKERREAVSKALQSLPVDYKEILILRDINEFTYEEISETLSMNIGTVKSRIKRARDKLKKILLQDGNFFY